MNIVKLIMKKNDFVCCQLNDLSVKWNIKNCNSRENIVKIEIRFLKNVGLLII